LRQSRGRVENNPCSQNLLNTLAIDEPLEYARLALDGEMQDWQLCHLAMVVPIADAYYMARNPQKAWEEDNIMQKTAIQWNSKTSISLGIPSTLWGFSIGREKLIEMLS